MPFERLPFVTVMVATYNGAATIGRALESLKAQTYPSDRFEILVIDDGSSQDIEAIVAPYNVRFERLDRNSGISAARNRALALARGTILAGIDDDCIACPDWLEWIVRGYAVGEVAGVGGSLLAPDVCRGTANRYMAAWLGGTPPLASNDVRHGLWRRFFEYLGRRAAVAVEANNVPAAVAELYGANGSFPVDVLRTVGGWDARMHGVEDTDISRRIREAYPNRLFYAVPQAQVVHAPEMTLTTLLRRPVKRGAAILRFYRVNGLVPPIYPFPLIWLGASVAAGSFIGPWYGLFSALVLPALLYGWWLAGAVRARRADMLVFGYLQMAEEAATVIGLASGLVGRWRQRRKRPAGRQHA